MDQSKEDDRRPSPRGQSRTDSEDTPSEDASHEEPRYGKMFMKRLAKQLKSPSLYQKGAMKLAEKVKLRKPLCAKSREGLTSDEITYPLSYESEEVKAEKKKKMSFEDVNRDITDEELVMNANVIIDAIENRLKLTPMPDIE
ncbi:hypothetical protein OESDEN_06750 [Oesophagostomum dentatum]|uniref:Uncharacterized protein n=1 Tax=Oesophagostomum dentatum TaxID=61180 RepID=A0A0B1T6Z6_OESDE|nr:hypothetical protein OESDEN_06750 [Oesophagostomum dentatum]